ncbi:4Fe-4S dicluster domain-containing protein [Pseudochryseolinea flava]|uniref:4Fe-4S ferredoxin n=1 Tax=Pseudochryseolinea flava TaxID=2059302 RepID=A0A364Y0L5_9BACT|nr:4Fe-4S dicluster domain-containing protein [Pseudochryseolinea flava]RAV99812.1 4Fe-4S ferredoxin [Pseudochryseolinea flava]
MEASRETYWQTIVKSITTLWGGLKITFRHMLNARHRQRPVIISSPAYFDQPAGISTIEYPYEMQPVPDNGRYRLHNEIDDCIVCDKCAKVCPVNCITIEPIKSAEEFGKTSDGTSKRIYAAKFDIDMGKCCFCGLCTTVCPTECLTMTKVYDFSVFDIREHNFVFGEMTPSEIEEKKNLWEESQRLKAAAKAATAPVVKTETTSPTTTAATVEEKKDNAEAPKAAKPVFRPKIKPLGPPPSAS